MKDLEKFQKECCKVNNDSLATRQQISKLYEIAQSSLNDNIKRLKKDGLINGTKFRLVAQDGKLRELELFTMEETIAIGFRLRSETALRLQRYSISLLKTELEKTVNSKILLEKELGHLWNQIDKEDLY